MKSITLKEKEEIKKEEIKKEEIKKEEIKKEEIKSNEIHNNKVRKTSNMILNCIDKKGLNSALIGGFYVLIHNLIIFLVGFVFIFNTSIVHLIILLIVVSLDAVSIVFLHGCPLTNLEQKYLGINVCEERCNNIKKLGIFYKCDHEYEKQVELLINIWTLIALKCLLLLGFKTFNLKLNNFNNIYT